MSKKYAMGIDLGTGGVRVGLFTLNIRPDMENHRKYQFYLKKYEEAYLLMKDWMHEVSAHAHDQK
jgi:sugar (pentulose or hexulose) kinase